MPDKGLAVWILWETEHTAMVGIFSSLGGAKKNVSSICPRNGDTITWEGNGVVIGRIAGVERFIISTSHVQGMGEGE